MKLILYGTSACHLCELAEQYLQNVIQHHLKPLSISFEKVDIALDEQLLNKYGLIIPVIQRVDNFTELHWPFTEKEILTMIIMKKQINDVANDV